MGLFKYEWWCPLCRKQGALIGGAKPSDCDWANWHGGTSVCKKCVKNRREEIDRHNEMYYGIKGKNKDSNCDHEWVNPYFVGGYIIRSRWYCMKCGAVYQIHMTDKSYDEFMKYVNEDFDSFEDFLAEKSW